MAKPNLNLSGLVIFVILGTAGGAFAEKQLIDDDTGSTVEQYFPRKQVKAAQVKPVRKAVEPSDEAKEESADGSEEVRQPYKEADDGLQLRQMRRVGVGVQAAGALGLGGVVLDLNFAPQWSVTTGFGGGSGFQAFEFQAKYVLSGTWIMPYATFGYSRWYSVGTSGPIGSTNPPVLGDRLLNDSERATGQFAKNLLYPGLGLQFTQLHGEWAGTSIYAELTVLLDVGDAVAAPTGALGIAYYF